MVLFASQVVKLVTENVAKTTSPDTLLSTMQILFAAITADKSNQSANARPHVVHLGQLSSINRQYGPQPDGEPDINLLN